MSASTIMPALQSLLPVTITPTRRFKASESLASLEKIDHVEINNTIVRGGVVFYVLDVYLKHCSSRIPTNKTAKATSSRPDYRLERRFTDFVNLRYQVWAYTQRKCQDGFTCRYCDDFMNYIVHSMSQPRLFVKVAIGVETRSTHIADPDLDHDVLVALEVLRPFIGRPLGGGKKDLGLVSHGNARPVACPFRRDRRHFPVLLPKATASGVDGIYRRDIPTMFLGLIEL